MNPSDHHSGELLESLFAEARAFPPDTSSTEYALETRVMALVRERRAQASPWALISWRLLPFFACIALAAGFWEQQSMQTADDAARLALDPNAGSLHLWEGWN